MKNNILTGSLYTAGILLPQITFAEIQNDKVSPDRPNIIFILADDMGSVSYTHLTLPTILRV